MSITRPASAHEDRRERLTDEAVEARRRTTSIVDGLGRDVRRGRRRLRLTQAQLAERVGVHQTWISEIELGRGVGVPLSLWVRLGVVLGQALAVSFSKTLDPGATLADAGHLEMQEALTGLATATGRSVTIERPTRPDSPSHSTDVAIHDDCPAGPDPRGGVEHLRRPRCGDPLDDAETRGGDRSRGRTRPPGRDRLGRPRVGGESLDARALSEPVGGDVRRLVACVGSLPR